MRRIWLEKGEFCVQRDDLILRDIYLGPRRYRLAPKEADLLRFLMLSPHPLTTSDLVELNYSDPDLEPKNPNSTVRTRMTMIRRTLCRVGWSIASEGTLGFRLEPLQSTLLAAE